MTKWYSAIFIDIVIYLLYIIHLQQSFEMRFAYFHVLRIAVYVHKSLSMWAWLFYLPGHLLPYLLFCSHYLLWIMYTKETIKFWWCTWAIMHSLLFILVILFSNEYNIGQKGLWIVQEVMSMKFVCKHRRFHC